MAARAADWVDRVLPHVGVRQWVLTFPWSRRFLLARYPELVRGVLALAIREITTWYRLHLQQRGLGGAKTGSITVVQRFG